MKDDILRYEDFINLVIAAVETAGVDYMIGGAVAAWAWGEPRATLDLDIVVNIPLEAVGQLSKELEKRDMLVPEEVILDNIMDDQADLPINAIHMHSGYKADLYPLRKGDELRISAFDRRQKIDLGEPLGQVYLHSPEDLIIYKLWYYSISQQTKHIRDITSIVMTLGDELDYTYIENWIDKKGLTSIWGELLARIRAQQ
ncbi:MAG: hypothetical protein GTO18_13575 [Anaerolineales bacterium]|nr:hypothetical protein [Anaerolineales bacterium]